MILSKHTTKRDAKSKFSNVFCFVVFIVTCTTVHTVYITVDYMLYNPTLYPADHNL